MVVAFGIFYLAMDIITVLIAFFRQRKNDRHYVIFETFDFDNNNNHQIHSFEKSTANSTFKMY